MYAGINSITMNLALNKYFKKIWFIFFLIYSPLTISEDKTITYKCIGLSQFQLIGASGVKEELKINNYKFIENGKIKSQGTMSIIILLFIVIQRGMGILGVSLPEKM